MAEGEIRSNDIEDIFILRGRPQKQYIVKLSSNVLSISLKTSDSNDQAASRNNTRIIPVDDIYGCLCVKDIKYSVICHLNLYLYSLRRPTGIEEIFSSKPTLNRSQKLLTYGKFNSFEENFSALTRWHYLITQAIYLRRNLPLDIVTTKRDKRTIVFVNPASGAGKAYRLVMEYVVGLWSEAEFAYHMIVTEYAGHARDYVQSIRLADWSGIVVVSGDGLIFEVLNGLMGRPDWQEALKLPIGHLPGGSGNAFITSILRYSKQPIMESMEKFIIQAAVIIATHQVLPFDMTVIDTCDGQRLFSFLCIEWAVIADVDCDSEKYRFLGGTRFTVEAIKRILAPRTYQGYIEYIPYDTADDAESAIQITSSTTTAQLHNLLLPLKEPIPTDATTTKWRRINGPFLHVLISSKPALSKDSVAVPNSTLADGYLTLQFIRESDSVRMNLTKTFLSLSDGKHVDYDFVECLPIRAFRIVPSERDGNLMVDGEKVPYGPIQGEILPGLGRCMGKYPRADQEPLST